MCNISANIRYFSEIKDFILIFLFFPSRKGGGKVAERGFVLVGHLNLVEAGGGLEELLFDGLFHLAADAEVGVDLQYTLDFGVGIGGSGGEECGEFVVEGLGCCLEGCEYKVCFFVVADVLSGLFAKGVGVAESVEEVVLELEGKAEVDAELVEVFDVGVRGGGVECTDFECSGEEDSGFVANHQHIFIEGDILALLEVHVVLLAFADLDGCLVEAVENVVESGMGLTEEITPSEGEHSVA